MTDGYFELASLDHFWVKRRFVVFRRLAGELIAAAREIAEIGCGHGVLQRQIEDAYEREVTGFDLNEHGLRQNVSRRSRVCCYDIFQKDEALQERFDIIFLFDVLEHMADEDRFLKALMFHLAPRGRLIVNVPAGEWAFSGYDGAAGHFRRYSVQTLKETAESIISWVNQELSDQAAGGFYASQDADVSLDDDGDYFTWTLGELRAALSLDEARVMELYYDVEAHGEMHHNPEKNVLWIARGAAEIAKSLGLDESTVRLTIANAKRKLLAARIPRPTPFIDKTMYVSWNAMFVSTYFNAARTLEGELAANSGSFALKTIDRMLREAWSEENGFAHRIGGPALRGSLDDQVFGVLALESEPVDPRL